MQIKRITRITLELINELSQTFVKGKPDGKSGEWNLKNARNFVKNLDNIFLLAYKDNKMAGMVSAYRLQRMDDKKAELFFYEIGVKKEFRRKGIGRALIEELKKISKVMGGEEMFVLTNKSNIPAMNLYKTTGGKSSKKADDIMFSYKI
jgi:ribosomal protein S18 acetylase RimI-like enzyme